MMAEKLLSRSPQNVFLGSTGIINSPIYGLTSQVSTTCRRYQLVDSNSFTLHSDPWYRIISNLRTAESRVPSLVHTTPYTS